MFLLIIVCQWIIINCQLNLYDTDPMLNGNSLQFDCLYYNVRDEKISYQGLVNVIDGLIPYCVRPINNVSISLKNMTDTRGEVLSFEELRLANITAKQLLSWSAPIDLTERYQFYLNNLNPSLNDFFHNCTFPWFGPRCQYSFELSGSLSIDKIVKDAFHARTPYTESADLTIQLPCYIHIRCDRGGPLLCLDWHEVCDGRVDCLDGGLDEVFCFEMELNECGENEFRCHNGLCIPKEFWNNGLGNADCLDRSDELPHVSYLTTCYQDPTFQCEEHSCRPDWYTFACGDGQCVEYFDQCHNGRHIALEKTISAQGYLSDKCWIAMICLTHLLQSIYENTCEMLRANNNIFKFLEDCKSIFQFPIIPVYYGHIRLLYENPQSKLNISDFLLPDYVCYNENLCDFTSEQFFYENFTCLPSDTIFSRLLTDEYSWKNMIMWIDIIFRSCIIPYAHNADQNHTSLYICENSRKSISQHRIVDGIHDCFLNDDENYTDSCALNDQYRIRCSNDDKCLSPLQSIAFCSTIDQYTIKIPFPNYCDKIVTFIDPKERNSDESNCSYWPCNNMYSRCDGLWTCDDGRDEYNCHLPLCDPGNYPCVSPHNYTMICLPYKYVGDEEVHCLGASDELSFCRELYPKIDDSLRFRCRDIDECLPSSELCNGDPICPLHDDEDFCNNQTFSCRDSSTDNRTVIQNLLCQLSEDENNRIQYFSIHTSSDYPPTNTEVRDQTINQPIYQQIIRNDSESLENIYPWPWYCNRGLQVHMSKENNNIGHHCLCPPSYYGDTCQYQNQRISLTMGLVAINNRATYAIVTMLIDNEQQSIESYDQTVYIVGKTCEIKFNRYLLYPIRPKNISKTYSIRIDVFEKNTMIYIASWHYKIPFSFLPVNRMAILLHIPNLRISRLFQCMRKCVNGECIKYINDETTFCRCFSSWSGIDCSKKIDCMNCSPDSYCVGKLNQRLICVCPLNKFGPRCLLKSLCPLNGCENDGQCVPADVSIAGSNFTCICTEHFFGSRCQYVKNKVDIFLDNIDIPPYVLAYFFTISNQSEPTSTIVIEKLTLFQRIITFRISISYNLLVIKIYEKYYLAVIQQYLRKDISTSISLNQECIPIEELFNSTLLIMPLIQRVKFYHNLCQIYSNLNCFIDEVYLCLCTNERHTNCLIFDRYQNIQSPLKDFCVNDAQYFQDHPVCPSTRICVCTDCFYGNQCQFYAKGFGLTLDEILGYEIKRHISLFKQPISVQLSAIVTMIYFIFGIVNSVLAIITFIPKNVKIGCSLYLLASSIISLLIVILFTLKFWLLFLSHMNFFIRRYFITISCYGIEPSLKILLYLDNWFNACVAIERSLTVYHGIHFNKKKSKRLAKKLIIILSSIVICLLTPHFMHLRLFDDEKEDRRWCVMNYALWLQKYNLTLICFHFIGPLLINLFSSIFIIMKTAQQKATTHSTHTVIQQYYYKLKKYKHLLISPIILFILSLLHLTVTFSLDCNKSSTRLWYHLFGYFLSFIPSISIFFIFVLPSRTYKNQFKDTLIRLRRHYFLCQ